MYIVQIWLKKHYLFLFQVTMFYAFILTKNKLGVKWKNPSEKLPQEVWQKSAVADFCHTLKVPPCNRILHFQDGRKLL